MWWREPEILSARETLSPWEGEGEFQEAWRVVPIAGLCLTLWFPSVAPAAQEFDPPKAAFALESRLGGDAASPRDGAELLSWENPSPQAEREPKLILKLGLFLASVDTQLGARSQSSRSWFDTDFERDLGLRDRATLPFVELEWQLSDRWFFRLAYQRLARDGEGWFTFHRDNGNSFTEVNTAVVSHFKSDVLQVGVGYTLITEEPWEAALMLGTHVTRLQAGIRTPDYSDDYHEAAWAPLPDVGLRARYRLNSRWRLEGRLHYAPMRIGRLEGELKSASASLEYQAGKSMGLGVGYAHSELRMDYRHEDYHADLEFSASGPLLYCSVRY